MEAAQFNNKTMKEIKEIKQLLMEWIERHEKFKAQTPFVNINGKPISLRDIHASMEEGTELGNDFMENIITLTISMLHRDLNKKNNEITTV
jgi:hypothetical protein